MLNHIVIMGRLVRDVELRRTAAGVACANFTVAVDRDFGSQEGQKETDFIDCVAWRQTGEFVSKYFGKGSIIVVSGRLQIRGWTDKDGNKRKTAEIIASNCYFGGSKQESGTQSGGSYGNQSQSGGYAGYNVPAAVNPGAGDYPELTDDDAQMPF